MTRILGLLASTTLSGAAIVGIAALIAIDFHEPWAGPHDDEVPLAPEVPEPQAESPFDDVDGITFFVNTPVEDTGLQIVTGGSFPSAEAVAQNAPDRVWCYIVTGDGVSKSQIDLGTMMAPWGPNFTDLAAVDDATLAEFGFSRDRLRSLARSHCKFSDFDPTAAG